MRPDPFNALTQLLTNALGPLLIPTENFADLMHENVHFEFPYAPNGYPNLIVGRRNLQRHLNSVAKIMTLQNIKLRSCIISAGNDMAVLEFTAEAALLSRNAIYAQDYISVIHLKGGKISLYRDYWNPLRVLDCIKVEDIHDAT